MISEYIDIIRMVFDNYCGMTGHILLLFITWICIYRFGCNKNVKTICIHIPIMLLGSMICGLIVFRTIMGENASYSYYRFFWILPYILIIAYGVTLIVSRIHVKNKKIIVMISIIIIIALSGTMLELKRTRSNNIYKLDPEAIAVADIVMNDVCEDKKLMAPNGIDYAIRLYADIELFYGRVNWEHWNKDYSPRYGEGYYAINGFIQNNDIVVSIAQEYNFPYIGWNKGMVTEEYMNSYGYIIIGTTEEYDIYRKQNY